MEPWQSFIRHHAESHSAAVSGRSGEVFHEDWVFEGLGADQLRTQPYGLNSIAWLIWHIARTEDVSANVLLLGQPARYRPGRDHPACVVAGGRLGEVRQGMAFGKEAR